jgi:hypothetical protein
MYIPFESWVYFVYALVFKVSLDTMVKEQWCYNMPSGLGVVARMGLGRLFGIGSSEYDSLGMLITGRTIRRRIVTHVETRNSSIEP